MKLFITSSLFLIVTISGMAQTNLEIAILQGDTVSLQSFFETEKDINDLHIRSDYTCLNFAVKTNQIEIVQWLLENEANPDVISNGKSALMYAAKYSRLEIAKLLLEHSANKDLRNAKERSAMDYARKYEQKELYQFLKQAQ